jgi:hypothetical protein
MKEIQITQGKVALVDDEDFNWLSEHKWCALNLAKKNQTPRWYVVYSRAIPGGGHNGKKELVYMHRLIMGIAKGDSKKIDHKDHDPFNNQKNNLRVCDHSQNMRNRSSHGSSKYLGVSWDNSSNKWRAQITSYGNSKFLGCFVIEEDAAKCYNEYAERLHGEFANLNKLV